MAVDPIITLAELAVERHDRGEITDEALWTILQKCINATAMCNGYVEQFGMPFPDAELVDDNYNPTIDGKFDETEIDP